MPARIDAHQHFWQRGRFHYPWMPEPPSPLARGYLPRDLFPILERNRFEGSVAVQAAQDVAETEWLLELAAEHPFIRGVVGWVDLTDARVGDTLDRLQRNPRFKGVRHLVQDEPDDEWLLREDVVRGLRELESRGLPYDLLLYPRHLPVVPRLAEQVPRLRMVIDHIAKPPIATGRLEGWAEDLARAAAIPHVYVKLSGMITEAGPGEWKAAGLAPFVAHALRVFGPDRSMFGSDWPVCLLADTWKAALAAFTQAIGPQPVGVRERLLGANATEFYRLEG
jgi:L-fuconolactonase